MASLPSLLVGGLLAATAVSQQQLPGNYYDSIDTSSASALRTTLNARISGHTRLPYTASSTDTWDVLEAAQEDPSSSIRIIDIYLNASYPKHGTQNTDYNREHAWPKSFGFPSNRPGPHTDCHALFLCNDSYNTSRFNNPFDDLTPNCASDPSCGIEKWTLLQPGGTVNGTGVFPGNSNWRTVASGAYGSWQVWSERRGDIARAMFYLDVRYALGDAQIAEPDLILTDNRALIAASSTGSDENVAYMGALSTLLRWHCEDPPDAYERRRNDVVFQYQGNRNPFIDNPGWVDIVWSFPCTQPPPPTNGTVTVFGTGCGILVPTIQVLGTPAIGEVLQINAVPMLGSQALLQLAFASNPVDLGVIGFPGCTLYLLPVATLSVPVVGFSARTTLEIPDQPHIVGRHLFAQWLSVASPGPILALTPAVDIMIGN